MYVGRSASVQVVGHYGCTTIRSGYSGLGRWLRRLVDDPRLQLKWKGVLVSSPDE